MMIDAKVSALVSPIGGGGGLLLRATAGDTSYATGSKNATLKVS